MASTALSNFAQRVGSMRDKGRNSSRNRGGDFSQLFTLEENRKRLNKEEVQKIQDIKTAFLKLGQPDVPESRIEYALRSRAAQGDVEEAIGMLLLYNDSVAGVLRPYRPDVKMLGAENREKTTCWLDALLFAMFARTDVFEAVLHQQYADEERRKLIDALRLWVNLLRSGKLITTDIVSHAQSPPPARPCLLLTINRRNMYRLPLPNAAGRTLQNSDSRMPLRLSTSSPTNSNYPCSHSRPTSTIKAKRMPPTTTSSSPNACSM